MSGEEALIRVNMIGPLPPHWGGGGRWHGGGVASHLHGLLPCLPQAGVRVQLLVENSSRARAARFPDLGPAVQMQPMARSAGALAALGPGRVARLLLKAMQDELLRRVPLPQRLRFVAQAANFDRFLAQAPADLLHVQRAYHRQYLCQSFIGVETPLVITVQSANALLEPNPPWVTAMIGHNFRQDAHFIVVSAFVREKMVQHGADPDCITVIPNGVDVETFTPGDPAAVRAALDLPQDAFLALFSGNLIPRKSVDVLLRAIAQAAGQQGASHLAIVGDGPQRETLVALARDLGVAERVTFAGRRPLTEMPRWYTACDVYVMPSWAEGLSLAVLEAMASGRPVITTRPDVAEHDAVVPGETGLLTEYGNVAQLAHAMEQLMESPGWARQLGENGRRRAERRFSWPEIARRTAAVYRSALERQP